MSNTFDWDGFGRRSREIGVRLDGIGAQFFGVESASRSGDVAKNESEIRPRYNPMYDVLKELKEQNALLLSYAKTAETQLRTTGEHLEAEKEHAGKLQTSLEITAEQRDLTRAQLEEERAARVKAEKEGKSNRRNARISLATSVVATVIAAIALLLQVLEQGFRPFP